MNTLKSIELNALMDELHHMELYLLSHLNNQVLLPANFFDVW